MFTSYAPYKSHAYPVVGLLIVGCRKSSWKRDGALPPTSISPEHTGAGTVSTLPLAVAPAGHARVTRSATRRPNRSLRMLSSPVGLALRDQFPMTIRASTSIIPLARTMRTVCVPAATSRASTTARLTVEALCRLTLPTDRPSTYTLADPYASPRCTISATCRPVTVKVADAPTADVRRNEPPEALELTTRDQRPTKVALDSSTTATLMTAPYLMLLVLPNTSVACTPNR